jgi:release factor glutamine methyltransferase
VQLKSALASAIATLTGNQVPSPRLNAELLLMFVLGCDRAYIFAHPERELTNDEEMQFDAALKERARGVPAQYITGHQEFWGMDLIVTPAVLIPRPETEHLIETVLQLVASKSPGDEALDPRHPGKEMSENPVMRIADVGTGSGCVALALAKEFPQAEIHATDISASALEIAGVNAARLQLSSRIHFHQADLLNGMEPGFDIVASNPPYVGEREEDQVQFEVRKFEPRSAVFAGPTGIEIIARLIPQSFAMLQPGGWLVIEISGTVVELVRPLLEEWIDVEVVNDLQSIPRVMRARRPM